MDKGRVAHEEHHGEEEYPCACYEGVVFIGHMVEGVNGEEVEVIEGLPCRACRDGDRG